MARCDPEPADGHGGGGGGGKAPAPRRRDLRWTEKSRKRFVRVLAESYDNDAAMAAADLTWPEVCELRVRHPDFAARIDEVIVAGFDRLEAALLRVAAAALAAEKPDMALVQAVMKLRRPVRSGAAPGPGNAADRAERERRVKRLMDKVAQLHAAQAGGRADGANDGRPHSGRRAAGG